VKSVEARSHEGTQTVDLISLQDLSQLLDQAVEGWCKHFDRYHSRELSDSRFEMSRSPGVANSCGPFDPKSDSEACQGLKNAQK
jgi:hypothetical protein